MIIYFEEQSSSKNLGGHKREHVGLWHWTVQNPRAGHYVEQYRFVTLGPKSVLEAYETFVRC